MDLIRCDELVVRPCTACGPDATTGCCVYHDGMDRVYEALERAHAVVVGSPIYFDGVSGPLKLVMDRCNCVTPLVTLPDGSEDCRPKWARTRHGVFVTACSSDHRYDLAERSGRGFLVGRGEVGGDDRVAAPGQREGERGGAARAAGAGAVGRKVAWRRADRS